jgi:hypothetical protein
MPFVTIQARKKSKRQECGPSDEYNGESVGAGG